MSGTKAEIKRLRAAAQHLYTAGYTLETLGEQKLAQQVLTVANRIEKKSRTTSAAD